MLFDWLQNSRNEQHKNNASIGWLQTRHNRLVWKKILSVKLGKKICLFIRQRSMETKQKQR